MPPLLSCLRADSRISDKGTPGHILSLATTGNPAGPYRIPRMPNRDLSNEGMGASLQHSRASCYQKAKSSESDPAREGRPAPNCSALGLESVVIYFPKRDDDFRDASWQQSRGERVKSGFSMFPNVRTRQLKGVRGRIYKEHRHTWGNFWSVETSGIGKPISV